MTLPDGQRHTYITLSHSKTNSNRAYYHTFITAIKSYTNYRKKHNITGLEYLKSKDF